ncbi:hypothetical protein ACFV4P_28880 [Kitasatospora sp. NPDC059795]
MRGSHDGTALRALVYAAVLGGIVLWFFLAATAASWIDKLAGG